MHSLKIAVLALALTVSSLAGAEPNPFSRPKAPGTAPGPESTSLPATGGNPNAVSFPPGVNPGMPPGMQQGMPGLRPGMPNQAIPSVSPKPPVEVPIDEQEVKASYMGTVNGVRIYRGTDTYLFEKEKTRKVVRKLVDANSASSSAASQGSAQQPGSNSAQPPRAPRDLPSIVGTPLPKK